MAERLTLPMDTTAELRESLLAVAEFLARAARRSSDFVIKGSLGMPEAKVLSLLAVDSALVELSARVKLAAYAVPVQPESTGGAEPGYMTIRFADGGMCLTRQVGQVGRDALFDAACQALRETGVAPGLYLMVPPPEAANQAPAIINHEDEPGDDQS